VAAPAAPVVMWSTTSLTVRKASAAAAGSARLQVITAKDGWTRSPSMKDALPDVMLVDIEMPRMDGFDLTRNLRGRSAHARRADHHDLLAHRRKAPQPGAELGVNVFSANPTRDRGCCRILDYIKGGRP